MASGFLQLFILSLFCHLGFASSLEQEILQQEKVFKGEKKNPTPKLRVPLTQVRGDVWLDGKKISGETQIQNNQILTTGYHSGCVVEFRNFKVVVGPGSGFVFSKKGNEIFAPKLLLGHVWVTTQKPLEFLSVKSRIETKGASQFLIHAGENREMLAKRFADKFIPLQSIGHVSELEKSDVLQTQVEWLEGEGKLKPEKSGGVQLFPGDVFEIKGNIGDPKPKRVKIEEIKFQRRSLGFEL